MKVVAPALTPERLYNMDKRGKAWNTLERDLQFYEAKHAKQADLVPHIAEARAILHELSSLSPAYREQRLAYLLKTRSEAKSPTRGIRCPHCGGI